MENYKGMNFQDWCKLDENDERKICYDQTPFGKFTSEDIPAKCSLSDIRECFIKHIELFNNEWHVHLVKNKAYATK